MHRRAVQRTGGIPGSLPTLLATVAALSLVACGGLPSSLVAVASQVPERIQAESARIAASARQFGEFRQSDAFEAVRRYADRESWEQKTDEARARVQSAIAVNQHEIQPFLERNDPSEADALRNVLAKINPLLRDARDAAEHWTRRRDFLLEVAGEPARVMRDCSEALAEIRQSHADLEARASRARLHHSVRADEISGLVSPFAALASETEQATAAASSEFSAIQAGDEADLALLGDSCHSSLTNRDEFLAGAAELGAKLAELDRSYSRTLIDMNAEYGLLVRRQTWDDWRDYPALHDLDFRIDSVGAEVFEAVLAVPGSLAVLSRGWTGLRIGLASGLERQDWDALGIDPFVRWPEGDSSGEIWVERADTSFFHKYLIQENGEVSETGWTPVSEEFFLANLDNLGMDVESKPH